MNFFPPKLLPCWILPAFATALSMQVAAYDIPAFHNAPFDRDGIFLEDGERQSLLEALAAISSNFRETSSIDEDLVEKALGIALAIDPFHGNSRKAHEALAAGERPAPTDFYDSRSAAAEALWSIASELLSPPVEPEGERLAPLLMEIALLVHPSTDPDRIVKFASLSGEIDKAWAGFVDLQPELHDSNLKARSFRREAKDLREQDASEPNRPEKPGEPMAESRPEPDETPEPPGKPDESPMTRAEIPPVVAGQRSIRGVFPAGDQFVPGTFQLNIRAASGAEEVDKFPFLLEKPVEEYPILPIAAPEGSEIPVARNPLPMERARELGISWQRGAVGETDFLPGSGIANPPTEPVRVSLPLVLSLQAISRSQSLNPAIGIVAMHDRDETPVQRVVEPAEIIEVGRDLGLAYLLVPERSLPGLVASLKRTEELELLFHAELLSFASLEAAYDLVTLTELPEAMVEASEIFAEIRMVSDRMPLPELARNEKVQERLEEILVLVPNHVSAKAMLEFGRTPVDEEAQVRDAIREIDEVIDPFFVLRRDLRSDEESLLALVEEADATLFRLRTTIPAGARDYHGLATDMLEAAETYLNFTNKDTSIAEQRLEETQRLLDELTAIKVELGIPVRRRPPRF